MRRGLAVSKANSPGKCHTDPHLVEVFTMMDDDGPQQIVF